MCLCVQIPVHFFHYFVRLKRFSIFWRGFATLISFCVCIFTYTILSFACLCLLCVWFTLLLTNRSLYIRFCFFSVSSLFWIFSPKFRAILRRGFAFSASIKNPPLLKSRNIQSQCSITANVSVPLIGGAQPLLSTPQTTETTVQIKDTSKQQHHTSIPGPTTNQQKQQQQHHPQVQQKLSNEAIDDQNSHPKTEHIVWPTTTNANLQHINGRQNQIRNRICNYIKRLCLILFLLLRLWF